MKIIKANASHAESAYQIRHQAIWAHCIHHYDNQLLQCWTAGEMSPEFIADVQQHYYLCVVNEQISATGMIDLKQGKVDAIFVHPNFMRQGIASAILTFLEQQAIAIGIKQISLEATLNAAPFYRKCGFIGDTVSQYQSPRGFQLDCIPMTKCLF
ncbi:GNAT family N-acetyltransferase [Shewanella marina]|uniref:GNAT family N-acetyltransferase n=1 Tax=Shewanella marina TaxID=487319 RepID=UPI00046EE993|nr:GNAT family N-acetyltransferase [Shewanella marina]